MPDDELPDIEPRKKLTVEERLNSIEAQLRMINASRDGTRFYLNEMQRQINANVILIVLTYVTLMGAIAIVSKRVVKLEGISHGVRTS